MLIVRMQQQGCCACALLSASPSPSPHLSPSLALCAFVPGSFPFGQAAVYYHCIGTQKRKFASHCCCCPSRAINFCPARAQSILVCQLRSVPLATVCLSARRGWILVLLQLLSVREREASEQPTQQCFSGLAYAMTQPRQMHFKLSPINQKSLSVCSPENFSQLTNANRGQSHRFAYQLQITSQFHASDAPISERE